MANTSSLRLELQYYSVILLTELEAKLSEFVLKETCKFYDQNGEECIQRLKTGKSDVKILTDRWIKAYTRVLWQICQKSINISKKNCSADD